VNRIIKRCLEISTEKLKSALEDSRKTQRPLPQLGVITPRPSWRANLTQGKSHFKERWDIRTLCANQPCQANQQRDTDRVRFEYEIGLRYFLLCTRQNRVDSVFAASLKRTLCLTACGSKPIDLQPMARSSFSGRFAEPVSRLSASRNPLWLPSGWGCRGRRLSRGSVTVAGRYGAAGL
jgi:hypothetical protein